MAETRQRVFLFLQGPHGPFFRELGRVLKARGVEVLRVAFNASDEGEWRRTGPLLRFDAPASAFEEWLRQRIEAHGVTDIVLYGDTRPVHATALEVARDLGLTPHCLEEGYLRPSWITYERGGNNGHSQLMDISLPRMAKALGHGHQPEEAAPATWGDARQHLWFSALYHARCLLPTQRYGRFRGHRDMPLLRECSWYWLRTLKLPWIWAHRSVKQWLLLRSRKTFHLALLQLSFDASMQVHSNYQSTAEFVEDVIDAFAEGAEPEDYLVFKAHPFEDGREQLGSVIRDLAHDLGVGNRVLFIDGGKRLANLLDGARSAITVNSTAAQQALWRGLPVAAMGRAIYKKPGLVAEQPLPDFLRHPRRPDLRTYWLFRQFMMETSQLAGSFYAKNGIQKLLERLPDAMLAEKDLYAEVLDRDESEGNVEPVYRPTLIKAS
ncbi:MAG: capsule biosynthesis protein [Paracoccaceae bacterium]